MNAFETTAVLDDAPHLTLRDPVPHPVTRECRVIVLYDAGESQSSAWPAGFFEDIRVADPRFARLPQGETRPLPLGDDVVDP